jgi:hypothetical protein
MNGAWSRERDISNNGGVVEDYQKCSSGASGVKEIYLKRFIQSSTKVTRPSR